MCGIRVVVQAKTRKLAERKVSKAELEEMERRRRAEEAEDRGNVMRDLRCAISVGGSLYSLYITPYVCAVPS